MSEKTTQERWEILHCRVSADMTEEDRISILAEIDRIDQDTPWQSYAPFWWEAMMDVRRELRNQRLKFQNRSV